MHVPGSRDIEGGQISSEPLIEPLHLAAAGTRLVSYKFGPPVAASVDYFKNAKRSLEAGLVDPFEKLPEMDVHRLAVWLVHQLEASGELENRHRPAAAMSVARSRCNGCQAARLRARSQARPNQIPILRQPLQQLQTGIHPVHGCDVKRTQQDRVLPCDRQLHVHLAEAVAEAGEPLFWGFALQHSLQAGDVQLEHHHQVQRPLSVLNRCGRTRRSAVTGSNGTPSAGSRPAPSRNRRSPS